MSLILSVGILLAFVGLALGVVMARDAAAQGKPHRVIVILDEDGVNEDAQAAIEKLGGRVLKDLPLVNGLVVLLPGEAEVLE